MLPEVLQGIRVLIIDDNPTVNLVLERYLKVLGLQPVCCISAEDGLLEIEQSHEAPFDLILMDWKMPGMDGIAASRRIRANSNLMRQPKIILVTAYGGHGEFGDRDCSVIDATMLKPVSLRSLVNSMMSVFDCKPENIKLTSGHKPLADQAPEHLRGARLLLAEDHEINLLVARGLLDKVDISVRVAHNGLEVLKALNEEPFDGVLMDLQMPKMGGIEAARKIRQERRFDGLPIIAMTANTMVDDVSKCKEVGMDAHISKPINPEQLYQTLGQHIRVAGNKIVTAGKKRNGFKLQEFSADLPQLAGINVEAGLQRLAGDKDAYCRVLKKFRHSHGSFSEQLNQLMNAGQHDDVLEMLHGLKGVSGNIGADALHQATKQLELSLKQESSDAGVRLAAVISQLDTVMQSLRSWSATGNDCMPQQMDLVAAMPLLEKMRDLLMDSDGDASDYMNEIKALFQGSEIEAEMNHLHSCIDQYDYQAALNVINRIVATAE
ncbi:MAG: hypothetical protein CO187_05835 [Zetaproteobacteria bacterium CG_4_9_14_3_um_filter_53_7]|nr:MAG: hypothetical protein CO187_05835 [Zetaproteobacteria bacterium CG_4_9_14_3_um_filter_53_7]